MQAAAKYAMRSYASVQHDVSVMGADSHQLILMLFDAAGTATLNAKNAIARGDTAAKCAAIDKASLILNDGLRASLDMNAGGQLAQQLHDLYAYMSQRLLHANLRNDAEALAEVARLLSELRGAWAGIAVRK
jgi:flagellar secretion chaperone FliS